MNSCHVWLKWIARLVDLNEFKFIDKGRGFELFVVSKRHQRFERQNVLDVVSKQRL